MKYLKLFENSRSNVQSCTFRGVEYNVGDMISLDIDLISKTYPRASKPGFEKTLPISRDVQYEIIEIIDQKKAFPRRQYLFREPEQFYNIHIFNDKNEYINIPIEYVYKELESTMTKYNL